ncbi:MAG: hypothetical protein CFE21_02910 [Bacteroidetes bacterium B1(2017)]|nr:MAG: hypothetical protein CFE21_02910 [Bacteroidetes bacterium B1(2017)]
MNFVKSKNTFLVICFLLCFSSLTKAQDGAKLKGLVNRFYRIMEGDSAKPRKNYFFTLPIWAVTPETGIKLGLSLGYMFRLGDKEDTRPSMVRVNTSYTQMGQFNIRPGVDIFFDENKYNLKAQYVYNDFNEYYWGIGNQAADSAKELYDFQQHKVNARLTRQVLKSVYVGGQLMYEKIYDTRFKESSLTPSSSTTGINGYDILGAGLALAYDNRDNIYYPLKGAYVEISNYWFFRSNLGHHAFQSVTLDARKFFCLWKENVLAVQAYGSFNEGDVPYRQMGTMGNEMIMRGYYNGRFRDNYFASTQAEFRKTVWGPLGVVVFGGLGNVGSTTQNLLEHIKPNYGFGFRGTAIRREHINARIDFGFGEGKIKGFYFTLSEAF